MKKMIIALAALMALGVTPVYAAGNGGGASTISVSGEGSVSAMPDMAVLSMGATTTGETTAVQQENAEIMEKVTAAIKASGVADADIETESYSLNPNYDYENFNRDGSNEILGYTMTHMLRVTVRDVDKAGDVLTAATEAGANQNWGLSFSIAKPEEYYNQALAKAIKNAEGKAKVMAEAIGVTISKPSDVTENIGYNVFPQSERVYDMNNAALAAAEAPMAAPVSAGKMEIRASVSVIYKY